MKNVIEPCCIATQLPQVMKTAKQGVFYSNGDWGVKALMNAVSYLVEKDATVVLLMPTVNVWFCRVLRDWLQRGWMDCVVLATRENCAALVAGELSGLENRVLYMCRKNLNMEAFIRYNQTQKMAVMGPLRVENCNEFCSYSYVRGVSWEEFGAVVSPIVALFAAKKRGIKGKCEGVKRWVNRGFIGGETANRKEEG